MTKTQSQKYEIRYKSIVRLDDGGIQEVNSISNAFNQFDYLVGNRTVLISQDSIKEVIHY